MNPGTPIITFVSDFGLDDWFVGVVHGVIHGICPSAHVVDLTHTVAPGDVARAAFVLEASSPDFPPGTIHLAVVDPGVGTPRRALAVSAHGQLFVGPDNGVLEWALDDPVARVHTLTEARWFRDPVSRTFHGRDVFAPVAAHLASGVRVDALGPPVRDPVRLERREPRVGPRHVEGCVMFVDRFGNALTDIPGDVLENAFADVPDARREVRIAGRRLRGIARTYGDASIGTLLAIMGSSGRLEIAEVGGNAASRFGFGVGDPVTIVAIED